MQQKIFLSILIFTFLTVTNLSAQFSGGNGTQLSPYLISNKNDMALIADSVNSSANWSRNKHFKLISDIPDSVKTVIGNKYDFNGVFDGDNKKITVSLNSTTSDMALFIALGADGVLKNLIIDGVVTSNRSAAGFVIRHNGFIENCVNFSSVTSTANGSGTTNNSGGIVANNGRGSVSHSKNHGSVQGGWYSGGIMASGGDDGTVKFCLNAGFISGFRCSGGINGTGINRGEILFSINIGTITNVKGDGLGASGGIVGWKSGPLILSNNINCGLLIKEGAACGGIIGNLQGLGTLSDNFSTGAIIGDNGVGGIIGINNSNSITISNNFYDKQMCLYGGINGKDEAGRAEGFLTKELIGDNLQSKLGNINWSYSNNLYPTLKALENEIISKIARSPAYLDDINADFDRQNNVRDCFTVNLENGVQWRNAFDILQIKNENVSLENLGEDTLYAAISDVRKTIPLTVKDLCQLITNTTKYTIRASKHPLTDPTRRNYRVPIFIKADEYVSGSMIDSLVVEIDRRIFYPKRVDNGDMSLHFEDTVIKMTFENVTVPELKANEEKVLLTIRGDVLLGEIDSSEIKIDAVKFAEQLSEKPELIHGFITLDICAEGGGRLVWFDYSPEVIVKNNPVIGGILELQCKTIERGSYSLEIVDMLGKSETVREFTVSANGKRIFDFEIPISNFSSGAYFIIMNTPTAKYSTKFVVQ